MPPQKILVVASTFPASDADPVPAFVKDQINAMAHAYPNLQFSVLAPHDKRSNTKPFAKHRFYDEYRFHYFWPFFAERLAGRGIMPALKKNPLNYLLIPFFFVGESFALLRLVRKLKPDVLYAHWFTPQAINSQWVGRLTKTPFVFTTHAADVDVWHKIPVVGKYIVRSNARRASAFTAVSRRSMGKLEGFFSKHEWNQLEQRGTIIPMGVHLPTISTHTKPGRAPKTILFMGRLAEKKGVQYLLPAYAALRQKFPKIKLIIAGDGPWLNKIQEQSYDLGIQHNVIFPGYVSGKQKESLLKSADIYVVPSIVTNSGDAEGLPVSLMEGLAYGKICIATHESGADDIITEGKDGFLVTQKSSESLQKALAATLQLSAHDISRLSQAAQRTARQFSWIDVAQKHYQFLFRKGRRT